MQLEQVVKHRTFSYLLNELHVEDGAGTRIRTRDLLITNQLLYQLSYAGGSERQDA